MSDEKQPDFLTPEQRARLELTKRENLAPGLDFDLHPANTPADQLPDLLPADPQPVVPPTPATEEVKTELLPPNRPLEARPPAARTMPMPFPNPLPTPTPAAKAPPPSVTDLEVTVTQPPTGSYSSKRPEWKVIEPEDRTDPVAHEQCEEHDVPPDFRLLCASIRGKLHAHRGGWRDDSYRWGTTGGWTILATADGAGSARLSRVGSRVACDTVVKKLLELLNGFTLGPAERVPSDHDLRRLRSFLASAAEKARVSVLSEAQRRKEPPKEFATTLLVVVHTLWNDREVVAVLQVGDGAVALMTDDGFRRLGISDQGEYSAETRFLTSPGMELELENRVVFSVPMRVRALALMTDGVSDDFFPEDTKLAELFDGNPIIGITSRQDEPVFGLLQRLNRTSTGEALRDWLKYEKRGSSDDRTLLLLFRS